MDGSLNTMPKLEIVGKSGVEYEVQCWVCSSRDKWVEEDQGVYGEDNTVARVAHCGECGNTLARVSVESAAEA